MARCKRKLAQTQSTEAAIMDEAMVGLIVAEEAGEPAVHNVLFESATLVRRRDGRLTVTLLIASGGTGATLAAVFESAKRLARAIHVAERCWKARPSATTPAHSPTPPSARLPSSCSASPSRARRPRR